MTFVRVPLLKIAMPKPPFGPYVDAVQKRERILALSRRIFELAERMGESDNCSNEAAHGGDQDTSIFRQRAVARIAKDDDDCVVNAQLSYER